ncbi:MAG: glycosyltransferase [Ignavibacteria bacterium]|jgi:glycosyltransferase involved in cell wall biosynthesis|nr:glycosyltransferase [Ignavibacteria bacterium]
METIGAAIIAKNESVNIERCLASVRSLCEQIVLVDTGSTDNTAVLAAKCGADVVYHKWQNDFSEARNYAISHLYTDWVLSIDADEELVISTFDISLLKPINTDVGGLSVLLNNFLDAELATSKTHRFTRIFRNDNRIRFVGKIHEQVAQSITDAGFAIIESDIVLNHYGYIGKNIEKQERNIELLQAELQDNADDAYTKFHLANTYFAAGNNALAFDTYTSIIASPQLSEVQMQEVHTKMAQILLSRDDYMDAISHLDFIASDVDTEGLRLSILGSIYLQLHDFAKAKEIFAHKEIWLSTLVSPIVKENTKKIFTLI